MTAQELIKEILTSELTDQEIHDLWDVLKVKSREVRTRKAMIVGASLKPGDNVKISELRQRELNGLIGKAVSIRKTKAEVAIPDDWKAGRYKGRILGIPMSCLEVVE